MSVKAKTKKRVSLKSKIKLESRCKWCGKPFKKRHNRQMYCSDEHRKYARQDQKKSFEWKRRRSPYIIKDDIYWGLGSGSLGTRRENDFNKEIMKIQNEKYNLGIK
jgi:hypothetical protein